MVFKPVVQDWDLFNSVVWGGAEGIFNDTYTSLAAFSRIQKLILHCSPAFCDMLHYTEVERLSFVLLLTSNNNRKNCRQMKYELSR